MSRKAALEQRRHALASANATKLDLPPPTSCLPSESTILRSAQEDVTTLKAQSKRAHRSARGKVDLRDQKLEDVHAQLQDTTHRFTAALQDNATMRAHLDGLNSRIHTLSSSLDQTKLFLGATVAELSQTQHELKMACSDLVQTRAQDAIKHARITEVTQELRYLHARAKRMRSERSTCRKQPVQVFKVKERGKIPLAVRVAVLRLVALGIGTSHVFNVMQCIARLLEVELKGRLSPASVRGIIHEGGVAAHLQVAEAMRDAKSESERLHTHLYRLLNISWLGGTISSNSTSIKSINYVAKHYIAISDNPAALPRRYALPITTLNNHSSQSQLDDWIDMFKLLSDMLRQSLSAPITVQFWRDFVRNVRGGMTDHAPDQKCMITLFTQWKRTIERESRGSTLLASLSPLELLELINKRMSADEGKSQAPWETLSQEDQIRHAGATFRKLCLEHGEAEFNKLSPEEQFQVDLFIWAGCCMHKSLNASRAAFEVATATWSKIEGASKPIPLLNKDNAAVLQHGSKEDQDRVLATAKGGAYKSLELLGTVVKNGDDKKGQQDLFKVEAMRSLGESLAFPDVSKIRFNTFLYAAAAVILNLSFFQSFLKLVYNAKSTQGWTNIEKNCAAALVDPPTLTELCAAAIYLVVVEKSYITRVRGGKQSTASPPVARDADGQPTRKRARTSTPRAPRKPAKAPLEDENMLDMADYHKQVLAFCKMVADDPNSLLSTPYPKTLDGQDLDEESRKIMDAVRAVAEQYGLCHLETILGAFFRGAYEKWITFTEGFEQDSPIAKLSPDQRWMAFLNTTNDCNEGALGMLRIALRRAPNISLFLYNSITMIKQNKVAEFFATLDPARLAYIRGEARRMANGSVEKLRRIKLAEHRFMKAKVNEETRMAKEMKERERKAREEAELQGVVLEEDPEKIQQLKGKSLDLQIKWHRHNKTIDPTTKKAGLAGISELKTVQQKKDRLTELAVHARTCAPLDGTPIPAAGSYKVSLEVRSATHTDAIFADHLHPIHEQLAQ